MHRHVTTVFVMLNVVLLLVTMHYLVWSLSVRERRLLLLKDWELKKVFQWDRQRGGWTLTSFLMWSKSGGCRACRGPTFSIRCSVMPLHRVRENMIGQFAGVRGSPPSNGIWRQKLPPWISSDLGCFEQILGPSIMMCTSWGGCWMKALVTMQQPRKSEGPSWNLSRSAYGIGGNVPNCWSSGVPPATPHWSSRPESMPCINIRRQIHMRRPWQWQKMHITRHSWWHTSWRIRLSSWDDRSPMDVPTAVDSWAATNTPTANDLVQLATSNMVPLWNPWWGPSEAACTVPQPDPPTVAGYLWRSGTGDRHSSMGATHTNPELKRYIILEPAVRNISCPPSLEVDLKHFLGGEMPLLRAEGGEGSQQDFLPEPPLRTAPNG